MWALRESRIQQVVNQPIATIRYIGDSVPVELGAGNLPASSDRLYVQPVPTGHQQCRASASTEDTHRWSPPRLYDINWSLTMPEASTSPKCHSASRPCRQSHRGRLQTVSCQPSEDRHHTAAQTLQWCSAMPVLTEHNKTPPTMPPVDDSRRSS